MRRLGDRRLALLAGALALTVAMLLAPVLPWAVAVPKAWVLDLATPINTGLTFLAKKAMIGPLKLNEITRALGAIVGAPLQVLDFVFVSGVKLHLFGARLVLAPVPWWAVTAAAGLFGHWALGRRGAWMVLGTSAYFLLFDLWEPAMQTLVSVSVSVALGVVCGVLLGVWAYVSPRAEAVLTVIFDVMQTLPVFSYLVPVLLFFGFGPVAALIATVVFAMPPMARVTVLALRRVPASIADFGAMAGATPRQRLWLVLLPAAGRGLLIGLNQVIMLSLSVVIIASIIGAGGLGSNVLQGLKSLQLGQAVEAGLGITLLAVLLDQLSRAVTLRRPRHDITEQRRMRHKGLILGLGILAAGMLAASLWPILGTFPEALTISTGRVWNDLIDWINLALQGQIKAISDGFTRGLFRPLGDGLRALPWPGFILMVAALAYMARGVAFAAICAAMLLFIALTGYWVMAMTSLSLVLVSAVLATLIGFPVGVWAARNRAVDRVVLVMIDTLQTLPTFVYLIPVVMLFGIGDFPAVVAITIYALPPIIRYTRDGLTRVPASILEAAEMSGSSPMQKLLLVQIPLALPEIMLGLSQTILMAFGMLVITALVGTRGLEQETLVAISKVRPGEGLVAGLGISFLSIITDRLITYGSAHLRQKGGSR